MNLRATHYGYTYQDLITGIALVDLLLGTSLAVSVDVKGFDSDRFDDLTVIYQGGQRTRTQIKHTTHERELSRATFSSDSRTLKLNFLLDSLLSDLGQHPGTNYRVLVRDGDPDSELAEVLKPIAQPDDPGDPFPGIATRRFKFDTVELRSRSPWKTLVQDLTDDELQMACSHLIIDTNAPSSTIDMTRPGPAELALLRRVIEELGAGRPPNTNRAPADVALAITNAATAARTQNGNIRREDISPRVGLTVDFGAVAEGQPVEKAVAVDRISALLATRRLVDSATAAGSRVILTGEPGVGKSWLCEQLADIYRAENWFVARHHCWLGPNDLDREKRVAADVVIGSLLSQLELVAPQTITKLRPRFAATPEALEAALHACREDNPNKSILLIVDGLDHVDRVLGRRARQPDPSQILVEQLAGIELPPGTCFVIASQPGAHLAKVTTLADHALAVPRMSRGEVRTLAQRHRLIPDTSTAEKGFEGIRHERAIVSILYARSGGNALYATYLCRHATRSSPLAPRRGDPASADGIVHRLSLIPPTATDLEAYYEHLLSDLTRDQESAIGALALCDFALSANELCEMLPEASLSLEATLETLAPVLNSQPGLGGLKIHHESFSRYILRGKPEMWTTAIRNKAVAWLRDRGFFADARAFRHLPELLADLKEYEQLTDLIKPGFVAAAIRTLQPPEALRQVLGTVARESEARLDWPTLMASVETFKAIDTYESESLPDTLVRYSDVVVSVLGADVVAERLLYEGHTTFPARWGLTLCMAVDRAGASAPWSAYLDAQEREAEGENVAYSSDDENTLHLATQLGRLRLRSQKGDIQADLVGRVAENLSRDHTVPLVELVEVFNAGLPTGTMAAVAAAMTDSTKAAQVYLALADLAAAGTKGLCNPGEFARSAWALDPAAEIVGYLRHGITPTEVIEGLGGIDVDRELKAATTTVLAERGPSHESVQKWLSLLTLAHAVDPAILWRLNGQLTGIGFYRAWLRFAAATTGLASDVADAVITPDAASAAVRVALEELADQSSPFAGTPRACDLYFIHPLVHDAIENALVVVQQRDLASVLSHLSAIGDRTTTSTMGLAATGPLATNDLLEILSRVSEHIGVDAIHSTLAVIRDRRNDSETQYSVTADFELATARICFDAGATDEAKECWDRAGGLLASYGGHKDPALSEFLNSVQDLATVDIDAARAALEMLLDPAYLVRQHTDGRGTARAAESWWEATAVIDPIAAAADGASVLLAEPGFEDGRIQVAQEEILRTQSSSADPVALAALRLAAGRVWRAPDTDLKILKRLRQEIGNSPQADALIASVANNISASYDDQPMMYASETNNSCATSELMLAAQELGGTAYDIRSPRKDREPQSSFLNREAEPTTILKRLESEQRPVLPEGILGAVLAARDFGKKRIPGR